MVNPQKKKEDQKDVCSVVDQFCIAPANLASRNVKTTCFSCGEMVCTKCSSLRKYHRYGRVRLCNDCQVEYDGNDDIVMKRMRVLADMERTTKWL